MLDETANDDPTAPLWNKKSDHKQYKCKENNQPYRDRTQNSDSRQDEPEKPYLTRNKGKYKDKAHHDEKTEKDPRQQDSRWKPDKQRQK